MLKKMTWSQILEMVIARLGLWFTSAGFIMWGWNTIAPHINCPTFTYWEIFAMRMGLAYFLHIFARSFQNQKTEER